MHANNMLEPAFPNDSQLVELLEIEGDLRDACARLTSQVGGASREALRPLLRAMNSYYSNKIEGQHTYPADLEAAIQRDFSARHDVRRRQELALAHMRLEADLESVVREKSWKEQFSREWICSIHDGLYSQLHDDFKVILDQEGNERGILVPGEVRDIEVVVKNHVAPPKEMLDPLFQHFSFRYGIENANKSRKIIIAGASMHRLSWIHPFADGNGRVSRLHNHLLLTHLGLTDGLWSPMRGLARKQADYYQALGEADQRRRNDTDGRGNLSSSGLAGFIRFWLEVCLDQVQFISGLLAFDTLEHRYVSLGLQIAHDFGRNMMHHRSKLRPELLGRAMHRLFEKGKLERSEFKAIIDASDRTASRVISQLLELKLVKSASRVGPLEPGLPFFSLRFLFPGLWPETEAIQPPQIKTTGL